MDERDDVLLFRNVRHQGRPRRNALPSRNADGTGMRSPPLLLRHGSIDWTKAIKDMRICRFLGSVSRFAVRREFTVDLLLYPTLSAMPVAGDNQGMSRIRRLQLVRPIIIMTCLFLLSCRDRVHDLCYADLYHIYFGVESRDAFTTEFLKVCFRKTMVSRLSDVHCRSISANWRQGWRRWPQRSRNRTRKQTGNRFSRSRFL